MLSAAHNFGVKRYYEQFGGAHDAILRCADCGKLVRHADLVKLGSCKCGTRRMKEVTTLSVREWLMIRLGFMRFPHRVDFLKEFNLGR